jgi:hypothetical protein
VVNADLRPGLPAIGKYLVGLRHAWRILEQVHCSNPSMDMHILLKGVTLSSWKHFKWSQLLIVENYAMWLAALIDSETL